MRFKSRLSAVHREPQETANMPRSNRIARNWNVNIRNYLPRDNRSLPPTKVFVEPQIEPHKFQSGISKGAVLLRSYEVYGRSGIALAWDSVVYYCILCNKYSIKTQTHTDSQATKK